MRTVKKVLVIRFSSIGDIVLTTPVVRCLKQQLGAEVHFCTKKQFKGLFDQNPNVDKVHVLGDNLSDLVDQLKKEQFDYVVDLHANLRSRIIRTRLGVKSTSFDKLNWKKFLLVNFKINKMPNIHIVERYMDTVKSLGVQNDDKGLDYFIPEKDEIEKEWLPQTHQGYFAAFAIGGQHNTKRLPFEKMVELCAKINGPIILLGGPEDIKDAEAIEKFFNKEHADPRTNLTLHKDLNDKVELFNGVGKFNLNQSASIVKQSKYVFTHDTGVMHIAAAFKKEVFSIWGNTVPELGMYPYQTKFTIFEVKGLSCRPCSKIGFDKCPKGHFKCMTEQKLDFHLPEAGY